MSKELSDISNEEIENELKPLLKNVRTSPSKFATRQKFINLLGKNGIELSKEEVIDIHIGEDRDNKYSQRINQFMEYKGYSLSAHTYTKP